MIKVAIVGYGNIGKYAVDALRAAPDMELAGIVRRPGSEAVHGIKTIRKTPREAAITNPRLAALAEKTALDAGIPFQLTVRRSGGTDAAALHLSGKGVPSIVLGIPTRYIHAHNGVLDLRDYRAAVELTVALARSLDQEAVEALTHYLP